MTLLKRIVMVAALGAAIPVLAQSETKSPAGPADPNSSGAQPNFINPAWGDLGVRPRTPLPKRAAVIRPPGESRLMMKFTDDVQARATADLRVSTRAGVDRTAFDAIATRYNLTFRPAFRIPADELQALERRAAVLSNKAQPDLAGIMFVDGHAASLQMAANELLRLNAVEWISFHGEKRPASPQDPGRDEGGIAGPGECLDCGDEECIEDCFEEHDTPRCSDGDCCDLVGDIRPFCINNGGEWDELCVAIAHLFCEVDIGADRCASAINGSCFEEHDLPGCVDETCCNTVCAIDPFCCEGIWDGACVALAEDNCIPGGGGGNTPDLTPLQGYLRRVGYEFQPGGPPPGLAFPAPDFPGYAGQGFYLFDDAFLTDHNNLPIINGNPDPRSYTGLYGLGRNLFDPPPAGYGVGPYNGARGRGIKVAVIEWAYYQGHEDLNVISEPGQTLIMIPDVSSPDHATACLGIINAQINNIGMNGIAPDAEAYFFPLTSIEDGPREGEAWVRCLQTLGQGDVISCSYGPGGGCPAGGNLNTQEFNWTLIRMASDLGITCCVAAGNSCSNLDDCDDFGDSGGIVVGAGTPGRVHDRLIFSNFYQNPGANPAVNGNMVHMQAWGSNVPATGGTANVFHPASNWNRSYCNNFNGTSAACPQVAGLAACIQGLAKQFYGIPLMSTQVRGVLANTGFPQSGGAVLGFDPALGCGPDTNPEEGPNLIGSFPRPERAGASVLSQVSAGFADSPLIDDVLVIRGDHIAGNKFSIKGRDNNFLVVNTMFTPRKYRPPLLPPAGRVTYLADGQVADIMVTGHTETAPIHTMQVWYTYISPGAFGFVATEMYDFAARKWIMIGFEQSPPAGVPVTNTALVPAASRFINQADGNKVHIRQYYTAVSGSGGVPSLPMRWDWINLEALGAPTGG
jgi:hypothetical protein